MSLPLNPQLQWPAWHSTANVEEIMKKKRCTPHHNAFSLNPQLQWPVQHGIQWQGVKGNNEKTNAIPITFHFH